LVEQERHEEGINSPLIGIQPKNDQNNKAKAELKVSSNVSTMAP